MNAKYNKWESYTDQAGRRHWRLPALDRQTEVNPRAESGPRERIGLPQPPRPQYSPVRSKDK